MMGLPIDIARGTEEDEETVQEGVAGNEGTLANIAEVE
jgi:hypothetical protein